MNKSDIVSRVVDRMGLSKSTAEGALDTVLGAISEALAREEDGADRRIRHVRDAAPECPYWPQSADRGERVDHGVEGTIVQVGQGAQAGGEHGPGTESH